MSRLEILSDLADPRDPSSSVARGRPSSSSAASEPPTVDVDDADERAPLLSHPHSSSRHVATGAGHRDGAGVEGSSSDLSRTPTEGPLSYGAAVEKDPPPRLVDTTFFPQPRVGCDASSTAASSESDEGLAGVRGIEAISQTWSKWSLIAAYLGVFLLAFATSLEQQTTTNLTAFATSSFNKHSLLSTISVVQGVVNAVIKPPMSKIANVFGRLEAFSLAVLLYICGYIQMAGSHNVETFASAQIFYSAGSQGLQILQQVFIADTSSLLTRALFSSLPDTPFLVTTWIGSPIAQGFLHKLSWRWGYGVWAVVLPVAFSPLGLSLLLNIRKARKSGYLQPRPWKTSRHSWWVTLKRTWFNLDVAGLVILSAAITLVLLPLTLASSVKNQWQNTSIIAMIVVGCACWVIFPIWELNPKLSPRPFLSLKMLKNRNVIVGCTLGLFYFSVFYLSVQPYFYSYLQVVQGQSVTSAGRITQVFSFSSTVTAITVSLIIWKTKHYKYFIVFGGALYMAAVGLLMKYRQEDASIGQLVGPQIMLGVGGGLINIPVQLGVQAAVPHADVAAATALFLTMVEIGGAMGSAISGAIWTNNLPSKLHAYLPPDQKWLAPDIYSNLTLAKSFPAGSLEHAAVSRSYQETMDLLLMVAIVMATITFILSWGLENFKLDELDQHVKGKVIGSSEPSREGDDIHETSEATSSQRETNT